MKLRGSKRFGAIALAGMHLLGPAAAQTNTPATLGTNSLSEHVAGLKVPSGFTVVVVPPFVVIGDEAPDVVRSRALKTVKWAVDKLKQEYFRADPDTIDIWLFRDKESYEQHARGLFNDTPTSRFGYYSAGHRALIMNISTGSGTLVHEIVHPFMGANFPGCPPWFNEGLASLYEASTEKDGHIQGLINWRFKGLEKAIKEKETIPFEKLMALSEAEFYGGNDGYGQYYAQARYLCYYLQERGLLTTYYREFLANSKNDPTGYKTLKRILRVDDMNTFQEQWEKFIMGIRNAPEP
jgi:hypothetical protein